jgi:hypothetical protein
MLNIIQKKHINNESLSSEEISWLIQRASKLPAIEKTEYKEGGEYLLSKLNLRIIARATANNPWVNWLKTKPWE